MIITWSFSNITLDHLSSLPVFSGVQVTRSLVFCVMFCKSLFVFLSLFFQPLCCLSFNLGIVIAPLVSSKSSCKLYDFVIIGNQKQLHCSKIQFNSISKCFRNYKTDSTQTVYQNGKFLVSAHKYIFSAIYTIADTKHLYIYFIKNI